MFLRMWAHWGVMPSKVGMGGLSGPEGTWNIRFIRVLGQSYLWITFPQPHYTTMPPLMKPLGRKLLYNKHDALKQNNSFINHTKEWCNTSGGSAAMLLPIYAVRTQIYLGVILKKVFPVHQPWALVSCIQPGLVICFTLDSILVSMLFLKNI